MDPHENNYNDPVSDLISPQNYILNRLGIPIIEEYQGERVIGKRREGQIQHSQQRK